MTKETCETIKLIFKDGSTVEEPMSCLKGFAGVEAVAGYSELRQSPAGSEKRVDELELAEIANQAEYAEFKRLWGEKGSDANEEDATLTAGELSRFFAAADSLQLAGAIRRRFAANVAKRALTGRHAATILDAVPHDGAIGPTLFQQLLLAFIEQIGFKARVHGEKAIFCPEKKWCSWDLGRTKGRVTEVSEAEEIMGVKRATLIGAIPTAGDHAPTNCAAVFGQLLCRAGIASLSIKPIEEVGCSSPQPPPRGFFNAFKAELSAIAQPHGWMQVAVEGLDLSAYDLDFVAAKAVLESCPQLKEVCLYTRRQLTKKAITSLEGCPELQTVHIQGARQKSCLINQLAIKLPALKALHLQLAAQTTKDTVEFAECSKLEELGIYGATQGSSFVQQLLEHVPALKQLEISVGPLAGAAAASFANCPKLEVLKVRLAQSSEFVRHLAANIPAVRELTIRAGEYNSDIGASLSRCAGVQVLWLFGAVLHGFYAHLLKAPLLDSLRELEVSSTDGSDEPSAEDSQAIDAAEKEGVWIWEKYQGFFPRY